MVGFELGQVWFRATVTTEPRNQVCKMKVDFNISMTREDCIVVLVYLSVATTIVLLGFFLPQWVYYYYAIDSEDR